MSVWRKWGRPRGVFALLLAVLCILTPLLSPVAGAEETDRPVVRVGFPIQKGVTEVTPEGKLAGYTHDYLMEIAQYTDWKYDFVQVEGSLDAQLLALLEMLEAGEIDLLGTMTFDDSLAELFDYVTYSYGTASSALYVLEENNEINSSNYFTRPLLRVAVIRGAQTSNGKLEQFCEMSGFQVEQVPCDNEEEMLEALRNQTADALLAVDINVPVGDLRQIVSFMPQPFYFAAAKGKKEIVNQLNFAISRINESNPYFSMNLHKKYFASENYSFGLSPEEKAYIASARPLRVAMMGGKAPIQYRDASMGEIKGLTCDLLEYITELTGLRFELVMADTYRDYEALLKNGRIDMAAGLLNDYQLTENSGFGLSMPYLSAPVTVVVNNRVDPSKLEGRRLALPSGVVYEGGYTGEAVYYDSIEKCLEAVHRGKVDYCYGNAYSVQYYLSNPEYKNMLTISRPDEWGQEFCFGVKDSENLALISILNKAIRSLRQSEFVQTSLYANTYEPKSVTLGSYIRSNPVQTVLGVMVAVMLVTIILLLWKHYSDEENNKRRRLENARYELISELSNEFLFEYDIVQDLLRLPEKCAQFLGCCQDTSVFSVITDGLTEDDLFKYLATAASGSSERYCRLPDGRWRWLRIVTKQVTDSGGRPIYTIGKIADIHREKEQQSRLEEKAQRDSLTELYNAAATRRHVEDMMRGGRGALLIIDVDRFKDINDTFGHYAGDLTLKQLARAFRETFRSDDILGRIGGDEFVVFMRGAGDSALVAEKCRGLQKRMALGGGDFPAVTISVGAAFVRGKGETYDELYQAADRALYSVKKEGRDGYRIAEEESVQEE